MRNPKVVEIVLFIWKYFVLQITYKSKLILYYLCSSLPLLRAPESPNYATKSLTNRSSNPEALVRIVRTGADVVLECRSCNIAFLEWTFKPRNDIPKDITKGSEVIKIQNHAKIDPWTNLSVDHVNCKYILFLFNIRFEAAGIFSCWNDSLEITRANLVVISEHTHSSNSCSVIPEPHISGITFFKQNDSLIIKCSFQYLADESCIVTPIWTDLTGNRNLAIPGDDFEVNMDNRHAWIHFRPDADITNGTYFNLSIAFSCSSLPHNNHIQYEFGQIPFPIKNKDFEVTGNRNQTEPKKTSTDTFNLMVPASFIGIAIVVVVVALILVVLIKYSRPCFAHNSQRGVLPEIPMVESYAQIAENVLPKDIEGYEVLDDGTYETIDDSPVVTDCANYIQIIE